MPVLICESVWRIFKRQGKQMAAIARLAGAPSANGDNRKAINWQKVRREVRRLQIHIAKAVEADSRVSRQGDYFGVLEPNDGKLSCTVLRGEGSRKAPDLPGGKELPDLDV